MSLMSISIKWGPICVVIPLIIGILVVIYVKLKRKEYTEEVKPILKKLTMTIVIPILINNVNELWILIILLFLFLVIMMGIDHL